LPWFPLQLEVAEPSAEVPSVATAGTAASHPSTAPQQQQQQPQQQQQAAMQVLSTAAAGMTGPAKGVDPVALADLGARAFRILADVGAQAFVTEAWSKHLKERAAMVRGHFWVIYMVEEGCMWRCFSGC
jgi:hypothetical protein